MSKLEELARRCEEAVGPNRDLDAEIAVICGLVVKDEGHPFGRVCYDELRHLVVLPSYSRIISDAKKLVPNGWGYAIGNGVPAEKPWAWCSLPGEVDVYHGENEALALCAAALRARAAMEAR